MKNPTRRRLISLFGISVFLALLAGCARYNSSIKADPFTGEIDLRLPKDARFELLSYTREFDQAGRPTKTSLTISNANFRMNPEVISRAAAANLQMFRAGAETAGQLLGAGAKAASPLP